jgi:UDP-3-O-[3-hydroxymyristoyl] glucosamine N-acyltransferase
MIFRRKYTRIKQWDYLPDGRKVQRIQAVRSFGTIKQGTIGGFLEDDDNLSHYGNCWIADNAMASGESRVRQNALLKNRARIDDRVIVSDSSTIQDGAVLHDDVFVYGNAVVGSQSFLAGTATVCGHTMVFCRPRYRCNGKIKIPNLCNFVMVKDFARLEGTILLRDHCLVGGNTIIRNNVQLLEHARIEDDAIIENFAVIGDKALICQSARVGGRTKIAGQCIVQGHSVILGKSLLLCHVRVGGYSVIENEHLSGDEVRWDQFSPENCYYDACIETLPARSG